MSRVTTTSVTERATFRGTAVHQGPAPAEHRHRALRRDAVGRHAEDHGQVQLRRSPTAGGSSIRGRPRRTASGSPARPTRWKATFMSQVKSVWSGKHTFYCQKDWWEDDHRQDGDRGRRGHEGRRTSTARCRRSRRRSSGRAASARRSSAAGSAAASADFDSNDINSVPKRGRQPARVGARGRPHARARRRVRRCRREGRRTPRSSRTRAAARWCAAPTAASCRAARTSARRTARRSSRCSRR